MSWSDCVLRTAVASGLVIAPLQGLAATEVVFCTDAGSFSIELNEEEAPLHAENFLRYVDEGHYSGTIFHRVIAGFMVQGGGFDRSFTERPTHAAVPNESRNGLSNVRGSIAAARTADPNSATAQFYINVADNPRLDASTRELGYSVFGKVSAGIETIDAIAARETGRGGPFATDVPTPIVEIQSAVRLQRDALTDLPPAELADRIRAGIDAALAERDHSAALDWLGRWRSTCGSLEPELLIAEANAALESGLAERARHALEQYFTLVTATDASYEQAAALYARASPGQQPAPPAKFGECRSPEVPPVPDGSVEDLDGMLNSQALVQAFMRQSNMYLECLGEIVDNEKSEAAHRESALVEYNRFVDVTQDLGNRFNEQVRTFRERQ